MGHRIQTFAGIVTNPMNVHNFRINIPGLSNPDVALIVESTQFPAQGQFTQVVEWFQGHKITYPGVPQTGGTWNFTVPESDSGIVAKTFQDIFNSMYNQQTGVLTPVIWKDVLVTAMDLPGEDSVFECILHGAWLSQKAPVNISAQAVGDSWKQQYTWVYQWIEDKKVGNNKPAVNPLK